MRFVRIFIRLSCASALVASMVTGAAPGSVAAPASDGSTPRVDVRRSALTRVGSLPDAAGARSAVQRGIQEAAQASRIAPKASPRSTEVAALAEQSVTSRIAVATITWPQSAASPALVLRTFNSGVPSAWQPVEVDESTGPGAATTAGSEPLLLTDVDRVQVAALAGATVDAALSVYSSPAVAADAAAASATTQAASPAGAGASPGASAAADRARPDVKSRAQWGANEGIVRLPYEYAVVTGAMIHHTAGSNSYLAADVPGILLSLIHI